MMAQHANPRPSCVITAGCHLSEAWRGWFEGLEIENLPDGRCRLRLPCPDQATLYGVLDRLRDLGIPLISVQRE